MLRSILVTVAALALLFGLAPASARNQASLLSMPRLLFDGDSIIANQPGTRRYIEDYLGDVAWKPQGYQQALGGQTALEILNGLNDTLSRVLPRQTLVVVGPIGANRAPGSGTYGEISSQTRAIYDRLLAAGAKVVAIPTLPDSAAYADAATRQLKLDLAAFVRAQTDITVVDTTGFDPDTMKNDGTHPNLTLGAPYLGLQTRAALLPLLGKGDLPIAASNDNLLGADWNFPGNQAVSVNGVTGSGPTGWTFSRTTGTGLWHVSKELSPDGYDTVVATISNAPDRTNLRLSKSVGFPGVAGDVWEILVEQELSGSNWLDSRVVFEGNSTANINASGNVQGLPAKPLRLRSSGVPLANAKSVSSAILEVGVDHGGSLTVKWRRAKVAWRANLASVLQIGGTPAEVGQVGSAYGFEPTVSGGTPPYAFSLVAGALPDGLGLNTLTGEISGMPAMAGMWSGLVLRVTDATQPTPQRADLSSFNLQVVPAGVPFNTVAPVLGGTAQVGQLLVADPGSWTNAPTGFAYQWLVDGNVDVLAAYNDATLLVPPPVAGARITVKVTASNGVGASAAASSAPTAGVVPGDYPTAWDETVNFGKPAQMQYSPDKFSVAATMSTTGVRYARSKDAKAGGRYYFELIAHADLARAGICDQTVGGSKAGTNGVNKVGWAGMTLYYSGGSKRMAAPIGNGDVVQIAVDKTNQLIWMRRNGAGDWNNTAGADPATGSGGLSIAGIAGPIHVMAALSNSFAARVTAGTAAATWRYAAPAGFGQFTAP